MKIKGSQLFWILATTYIVMAIGVVLTPTVSIVQQDAWISLLASGAAGVIITILLGKLALLHPDQSLFQVCRKLLGKWLGRIIVLPYFCAFIGITSVVVRAQVDFIQSILLNGTPTWAIMIILFSITFYLTLGGITNIGRFSEITGPIFYFLIFLSFILNWGNIRLERLLPVYVDHGGLEIVQGMVPFAPLLAGQAIVLLVLSSFMTDPKQVPSHAVAAAGIASFTIVMSVVMCIVVLGPELTMKLNTPIFVTIRAIDIMDFIQNLDVFFIFIAIFGTVIKLSSYAFVASYEMSKWLNLKNWKPMVWFVVPIIMIISMNLHGPTYMGVFLKIWSMFVVPICVIIIPLLLWITYLFKRSTS
ncbi:spore germination protein [Paenibacillus sp. MBLB2552]|uniref:Spore germination protein n=1 Tax=Paenibacillus mellifer TaxID=2937794 RepID=A0A9X1Y2U4_9BACL|nr:endospore germination permease [Paenibacillus mellifer]MCK8489912.1 spore germination protein [Paenibacillus mellifer]